MNDAKPHRTTNLTPQMEADILLAGYQARRQDRQTVIRELSQLQELINHLLVRFHASA
jgi:hypothetical protein